MYNARLCDIAMRDTRMHLHPYGTQSARPGVSCENRQFLLTNSSKSVHGNCAKNVTHVAIVAPRSSAGSAGTMHTNMSPRTTERKCPKPGSGQWAASLRAPATWCDNHHGVLKERNAFGVCDLSLQEHGAHVNSSMCSWPPPRGWKRESQ